MGKKAKGSRERKKAWSENMSTEDIEDYFGKSSKDSLSGGSLFQLPSESLLYVDKSKDRSVKRKIDKHRQKLLQCDSVLQKNPFVQALLISKSKKKDKGVLKEILVTQDGPKDNDGSDSVMVDIWSNEVLKYHCGNIHGGKSSEPKDLLFNAEQSFSLQMKTKLEVFSPSYFNGEVSDFWVVNSYNPQSYKVYRGEIVIVEVIGTQK